MIVIENIHIIHQHLTQLIGSPISYKMGLISNPKGCRDIPLILQDEKQSSSNLINNPDLDSNIKINLKIDSEIKSQFQLQQQKQYQDNSELLSIPQTQTTNTSTSQQSSIKQTQYQQKLSLFGGQFPKKNNNNINNLNESSLQLQSPRYQSYSSGSSLSYQQHSLNSNEFVRPLAFRSQIYRSSLLQEPDKSNTGFFKVQKQLFDCNILEDNKDVPQQQQQQIKASINQINNQESNQIINNKPFNVPLSQLNTQVSGLSNNNNKPQLGVLAKYKQQVGEAAAITDYQSKDNNHSDKKQLISQNVLENNPPSLSLQMKAVNNSPLNNNNNSNSFNFQSNIIPINKIATTEAIKILNSNSKNISAALIEESSSSKKKTDADQGSKKLNGTDLFGVPWGKSETDIEEDIKSEELEQMKKFNERMTVSMQLQHLSSFGFKQNSSSNNNSSFKANRYISPSQLKQQSNYQQSFQQQQINAINKMLIMPSISSNQKPKEQQQQQQQQQYSQSQSSQESNLVDTESSSILDGIHSNNTNKNNISSNAATIQPQQNYQNSFISNKIYQQDNVFIPQINQSDENNSQKQLFHNRNSIFNRNNSNYQDDTISFKEIVDDNIPSNSANNEEDTYYSLSQQSTQNNKNSSILGKTKELLFSDQRECQLNIPGSIIQSQGYLDILNQECDSATHSKQSSQQHSFLIEPILSQKSNKNNKIIDDSKETKLNSFFSQFQNTWMSNNSNSSFSKDTSNSKIQAIPGNNSLITPQKAQSSTLMQLSKNLFDIDNVSSIPESISKATLINNNTNSNKSENSQKSQGSMNQQVIFDLSYQSSKYQQENKINIKNKMYIRDLIATENENRQITVVVITKPQVLQLANKSNINYQMLKVDVMDSQKASIQLQQISTQINPDQIALFAQGNILQIAQFKVTCISSKGNTGMLIFKNNNQSVYRLQVKKNSQINLMYSAGLKQQQFQQDILLSEQASEQQQDKMQNDDQIKYFLLQAMLSQPVLKYCDKFEGIALCDSKVIVKKMLDMSTQTSMKGKIQDENGLISKYILIDVPVNQIKKGDKCRFVNATICDTLSDRYVFSNQQSIVNVNENNNIRKQVKCSQRDKYERVKEKEKEELNRIRVEQLERKLYEWVQMMRQIDTVVVIDEIIEDEILIDSQIDNKGEEEEEEVTCIEFIQQKQQQSASSNSITSSNSNNVSINKQYKHKLQEKDNQLREHINNKSDEQSHKQQEEQISFHLIDDDSDNHDIQELNHEEKPYIPISQEIQLEYQLEEVDQQLEKQLNQLQQKYLLNESINLEEENEDSIKGDKLVSQREEEGLRQIILEDTQNKEEKNIEEQKLMDINCYYIDSQDTKQIKEINTMERDNKLLYIDNKIDENNDLLIDEGKNVIGCYIDLGSQGESIVGQGSQDDQKRINMENQNKCQDQNQEGNECDRIDQENEFEDLIEQEVDKEKRNEDTNQQQGEDNSQEKGNTSKENTDLI